MAMSRRESITSPTVTTRSKSHTKKKPGRKPKPKMKAKSPQAPRKSRSPKGPDGARKVYRSAKTLDPNSETITISPTPPPSPINSPLSTPGRTPSPCDEDELFQMIKIEVDPVKPKPVKKSKPTGCKTDFYPDIQKRCAPEKQTMLQYKYNLRLITRINKRKAAFPKKEPSTEGESEVSRGAEQVKTEPKEEAGGEDKEETQEDDVWVFNDEDLTDEDYMEIFHCESPVWWEKAPNSDYDEEPIDRRLIDEAMKVDSPLPLEEDMEMRSNELHRTNQTFFKKKSKLESVLDSIKVKKAAVKEEDNEKRETRCSESSDGDIFADISLNDLEMVKSLEKIVIPVENIATLADVENTGENVDGSNDKVVEGRTSKNMDVEDIVIVDEHGKYAGTDTGEDAVEMCTENKNVGDISVEKADAYTEKEIEEITSNKEKRDEEIDTGDLQMYVVINNEDKLTFNNTTDADEKQRNNQTTIFTDLVAAVFDGEVQGLGKFQASSKNIGKSSTEGELGSVCVQKNSDNVSANEMNAINIGAECSELEKLYSNEMVEYNSKYTQQVESERICIPLNEPEKSHANQMDAVEIGAVRNDLENIQFYGIIVEECDLENAFETYFETKCTKQYEQEETTNDIIMVVELDSDNTGIERLHALKTDPESICIPYHRLEDITVEIIDVGEKCAKGDLDRLNVDKVSEEEINNQHAHETEAEIISTQQYAPEETGASEIPSLEVSVEVNALEDDHSDVIDEVGQEAENDGAERLHDGKINVEKFNSELKHEIEAKSICGQAKSTETSANSVDRKDLEKYDETIVEECISKYTDSEKEGIAANATDEVKKGAEKCSLERLHAGTMVMNEFIYEEKHGKGVRNRDTEKIDLKKTKLDTLNTGKLNLENLNPENSKEIESKSICAQQYTPEEKATNEISVVKMATDKRNLERNRIEIIVEGLDIKKILYNNFERMCNQQNNQEELSADNVNVDNIDPENRNVEKYAELEKIETQYRRKELTAKIIKLLAIYSRKIGLKRLYAGLINIGLNYQHLYKNESRKQIHIDNNLGNIDALETDTGKRHPKKYEMKTKQNFSNSQKSNFKTRKQKRIVPETALDPINSPQHSPDMGPNNMDAVETSIADIRVENSESDRISEELTESKIMKASNEIIEQIPVKMLGECNQLTMMCEALTNTKKNNLELCYDRINIIETPKQSVHSLNCSPNMGGNDMDTVVSAIENFDSERICEKKESEKISSDISNPKQTDILETALKSIFSEQLDPDMCGNDTETVVGVDEKQTKNWETKDFYEELIASDINYVENIKAVENDSVKIHDVSDKHRKICEELIHYEKIYSELCNSKVNVLEIDEQCMCSQQYDPVMYRIDKGQYNKHARNSQSENMCKNSTPPKRIGVENINTADTSAVQMYEVSNQFRKLCEQFISSEKIDSELRNDKIYGIEIISKNTRLQGTSGVVGENNRQAVERSVLKTHAGNYESEKMRHDKTIRAPKMGRRSKYEIYDEEETETDNKDAEFVVVATYSGNMELDRVCEEDAVKFSEGNNLEKIDTMDRTHDIIKDPEKCIPQNIIRKICAETHALNVTVEVDESYNNPEINDLGNTQNVDRTFAAKINITYITETKENDTIGETMDPVVINSVKTDPVSTHSRAEHKNENSSEMFAQVNTLIVDANKNYVKNEMYPKTTHPVETDQKCIDKSIAESLLAETRKTVIVEAKNYVQNELSEPMDPVKMRPIKTYTQDTGNTQNSTDNHITDDKNAAVIESTNKYYAKMEFNEINSEKSQNILIEQNLRKIRECAKTVIVPNKNAQNKLKTPLVPAIHDAERIGVIGLFSDNTKVPNANDVQNERTDTVDLITVKQTDTKEMLVTNTNKALVDSNKKIQSKLPGTMSLVKSGPSKNIEKYPMMNNTCTENTITEVVRSNKRYVPKEDSEKMDPGKIGSIMDAQRTYLVANKTEETTVGKEAEIYIDKCIPTDFSGKILEMDSVKIDPSKIHTQQIYTIGRNAEIRITENMEPEIVYPDNSPPTELSETDLLIVTPVRIDPIRTYARKISTDNNKKETLDRKNKVVTKRPNLINPVEINTQQLTGKNSTEKNNKVINTNLNSNIILLGQVNNEFTLEAVPINPRSNILANDLNKYTKVNSYADYLNLVIAKDHNYSKKVRILETLVLDPIVTNKLDQAPENPETNLIVSKRNEAENVNIPQTSLKEGGKFNENGPKTISPVKENLIEARNLNVSEILPVKEPKQAANLNDPENRTLLEEQLIVPINLNDPEISVPVKEPSIEVVNLNVPEILPSVKEPNEKANLNDPETLSLLEEQSIVPITLNVPEILPSVKESKVVVNCEVPKIIPSNREVNLNVPETISSGKETLQEAVNLNIAETPEILPLRSTEESLSTVTLDQPSTTNCGTKYETIILDDSDVEIVNEPENTNAESKIPSPSKIDDQNELVVVYRIVSSDEECDETKRPEPMDIEEDIPKIESKMDHKKTAKLRQIYGRRNLPNKYTHSSKIQKRKQYVLKISIDNDRLGRKLIRKIRSIQTCQKKKKKKRSRKIKCSCLRSKCAICGPKRKAERGIIIRPCLRAPNVVVKKFSTDESDSQCSSLK